MSELSEACLDDNDKKVSCRFCIQCEQSYCLPCSNAHSEMKECISHELVILKDVVPMHKKSRSKYCEKHEDEPVKLYCVEDKMAICFQCFFYEHRSHHCEEIKKIVDDIRIEQWDHALQTAIEQVDEKIEVLSAKKWCLSNQVENIKTKICEEADQRIKTIENDKQKLITEVHAIETNHEQKILNLTQEFTLAKSRLTVFKNYLGGFLERELDVEICRDSDSLRNETENLVNLTTLQDASEKLGVLNVIYSHSLVTLDESANILGKVKEDVIYDALSSCDAVSHCDGVSSCDAVSHCDGVSSCDGVSHAPLDHQRTTQCHSSSPKLNRYNLRQRPKQLVVGSDTTVDDASNQDTSLSPQPLPAKMYEVTPTLSHTVLDRKHHISGHDSVQCLALLDNELFVARRNARNQSISVFNATTLRFERSISLNLLKASGLAACPHNKLLFVSDFDLDRVHAVNLRSTACTRGAAQHSSTSSSWKVTKRPRGLSLTSKHNLLVACGSTLQVYSSTGQLLRQVAHQNFIWQAFETTDGTLMVSHCGPSFGISELSWDGQVLRSFTKKHPSGQVQMNPRSFVVTSTGNVLVADMFNNRIRILDSTLATSRTLELPADVDLQLPIELCYDESRGRMYVAEFGHSKRLLVFDHVTIV